MVKLSYPKSPLLVLVSLLLNNYSFAIITKNGEDLALKSKDRSIDSIIVKFNKNNNLDTSIRALEQYVGNKAKLSLVYSHKLSNGAYIFNINQPENTKLSLEAINTKLEQLNSDPNIKYADPNGYVYMQKTPNDSRYSEQWHYYEESGGMNLPDAWDITTGFDRDIIVGVVDTGIVKHEALGDKILPGQNFVDSKDDKNKKDDPTDHGGDTSYHGTHVAGTIAAVTDQDGVVSGISWGAKILPVRVLNNSGSGSFAWIAEGMRWAAGISDRKNPNPAKVINLSLGGFGKCPKTLQETIDDITELGINIVVAAGNSSVDAAKFTPANCQGVITVGATNRDGKQTFYSNYGKTLTIAAPGGENRKRKNDNEANEILSLEKIGKYQFLQGTSMATPHISGLVALMHAVKENMSNDDVINFIKQGASEKEMGVGVADAKKTLDLVLDKLPDENEPNNSNDN